MPNEQAQIQAYLNPADFQRIMNALSDLETTAERLEDDLPRLQSIDFSRLLANNILSGKHMTGYKAYHPRYAEWKDNWATYTGFWQAMGHLVNSLTFWKLEHGQWKAGIPEGVTNRGETSWFGQGQAIGKVKPIAMYAKTMEYGLNRQPKRPIFGPTTDEYKEGGFARRSRKALDELATKWR